MTQKKRTERSLVAVTLASLIIGLVAAAGAQPTLDDLPLSAFGDEITVRVINLEVVVTDRKGERVSGLRPEEFRLRVDGQETPIEFFSEIVEGVVEQGGEALPAAPGVVDGRTSGGVVASLVPCGCSCCVIMLSTAACVQ